jgi:hypothetical protein
MARFIASITTGEAAQSRHLSRNELISLHLQDWIHKIRARGVRPPETGILPEASDNFRSSKPCCCSGGYDR